MEKKAFVTGGSRGIGRGIVHTLAKNGYEVAFTYASREDEAKATAESVRQSYGTKCHYFEAKLNQPDAAVRAFQQAEQALGHIDLLVNNAGTTKLFNILEMDEELLDYMYTLDFRSYLILMREAARHMVAHEIRGNIISITSSRGQQAYPEDAVYGAMKAALERAVESVALDLAPHGIRVNNVAPGAVRVRTNEEMARQFPGRGMGEFWDKLAPKIPLERTGHPEDIGEAVAWLASDKAAYITGVTLRVDGGLTLPGMPEDLEPHERGWAHPNKKRGHNKEAGGDGGNNDT